MSAFTPKFGAGIVGPTGPQGPQGASGATGINGTNGVDGVDGLSAYEIAVAQGFVGTINEWILSLQGEDGLSAYALAVQEGFVGSLNEWILSLNGLGGGSTTLAGLADVAITSVANGDILSYDSVSGDWENTALTKTQVGLGNVDNTSDANKPVSTATQTALDLKLNANDASVTNARDWTATEVSQAEAEAGSATTARKWTAQRVRQAIAAWWASITNIDGKVIGATTPAAGSFTTLGVNGDINITGTARRITGDFSGATTADRVLLQTSTVNTNTTFGIIPNGTGTNANFGSYGNALDLANTSVLFMGVTNSGTEARFNSASLGTGPLLPMTFLTGGSERVRIDTSGNVLVTSAAGLGYGTGAGGAVTQVTSKGTAVTLNKPCGQITMHNEALAAGANIYFLVNNSLVASSDLVIINTLGYVAYTVRAEINTGSFYVLIKNETGGSRSEAVVINFAIIKGVSS